MKQPKTNFEVIQVLPREGHIVARSTGKPQTGIVDTPEKVEGTYIYFWHDPRDDKPKTQVWDVFSKSDHTWLAQIYWFAKWRCYGWSSTNYDSDEHQSRHVADIVFEPFCSYEIANFCKWLTKRHKSSISGKKKEK